MAKRLCAALVLIVAAVLAPALAGPSAQASAYGSITLDRVELVSPHDVALTFTYTCVDDWRLWLEVYVWQRERGTLSPNRYQGFSEACVSEPSELTVHVDPGDLGGSSSFSSGEYWLAYKPFAEYSDEKGDYFRPLGEGYVVGDFASGDFDLVYHPTPGEWAPGSSPAVGYLDPRTVLVSYPIACPAGSDPIQGHQFRVRVSQWYQHRLTPVDEHVETVWPSAEQCVDGVFTHAVQLDADGFGYCCRPFRTGQAVLHFGEVVYDFDRGYVWVNKDRAAVRVRPVPITCEGRPVTLAGTSGDDILTGTDGPDVIMSGGGADQIAGGAGDDVICEGPTRDFYRTSTHSRVSGGPGDDVLVGDDGSDVLLGGRGRDLLLGGSGKDALKGGADDDVLRGGRGRDRLDGGSGWNTNIGDGGTDTCVRPSAGSRAVRCEAP